MTCRVHLIKKIQPLNRKCVTASLSASQSKDWACWVIGRVLGVRVQARHSAALKVCSWSQEKTVSQCCRVCRCVWPRELRHQDSRGFVGTAVGACFSPAAMPPLGGRTFPFVLRFQHVLKNSEDIAKSTFWKPTVRGKIFVLFILIKAPTRRIRELLRLRTDEEPGCLTGRGRGRGGGGPR